MKKLNLDAFVEQVTTKKDEQPPKSDSISTGAPSVDFLNSSVPVEAPKSTIGIRKVQPRRGVISNNYLAY